MNDIRVTLLQTDIIWENKEENLRLTQEKLHALSGQTEIVVLPEMFTTGFSMNSQRLAENNQGETIMLLKQWSRKYQLALAGSFIAVEGGQYFNRGFFITPEGELSFYDKRHLFRMGSEPHYFSAGNKRGLISYKGWKINLIICYDLRFPVWCRNVNNEYDVLICVASWPQVRRLVWDSLLLARALENQCYVCGVNRVGVDGNDLIYNGGSAAYSFKGNLLGSAADGRDEAVTVVLSKDKLERFRRKFPVYKDADDFMLK